MTIRNDANAFEAVIEQHFRLAALRLLSSPCGGRSNEIILGELLALTGFRVTQETLRDCLNYLAKIGAISVKKVEVLTVVELTVRGGEIAKGVTSAEGIAKPGIDCPYGKEHESPRS